MKDKKLIFYTLYKEDDKTNDLKYISNFDNLDDLSKFINAPKKTIKNRISDKKKLLNNYIIYKDYINADDLI